MSGLHLVTFVSLACVHSAWSQCNSEFEECSSSTSNGPSTGVIVGIVIAVVGLFAVVSSAFIHSRRQRIRNSTFQGTNAPPPASTNVATRNELTQPEAIHQTHHNSSMHHHLAHHHQHHAHHQHALHTAHHHHNIAIQNQAMNTGSGGFGGVGGGGFSGC
ncbi:hypothetical protein BT96DRAFT_995979 [Gymnopus androsaceus JB14]|uniref:Uncharacterized protein n=1 Tax=Gymnopus androsaceus JB14 TaxID=1447944 RepID=A0A6A4HHX9_9AGAR|nr:hypothetical protein BT96DRAFT_995979 [Gymnopus androsaceus JB14]